MKEDILEQIVDEYLNLKGYFTVANVRYKPLPTDPGYDKQQDSVASDIDIIGYHPSLSGAKKVVVVACKSWQDGFWAGWEWDYIRSSMQVLQRFSIRDMRLAC
jgi:hypothetical protein